MRPTKKRASTAFPLYAADALSREKGQGRSLIQLSVCMGPASDCVIAAVCEPISARLFLRFSRFFKVLCCAHIVGEFNYLIGCCGEFVEVEGSRINFDGFFVALLRR